VRQTKRRESEKPALLSHERKRIEEEIRKETIKTERKARKRREKEEKARINRLLLQATTLHQSNTIRTYVRDIRALASQLPVSSTDLDQWTTWALGEADRIDPTKNGTIVAAIDELRRVSNTDLGDEAEAPEPCSSRKSRWRLPDHSDATLFEYSAGGGGVDTSDQDTLMRFADFEHVRRLTELHDHLTAADLTPGLMFQGERIPLINPQRGIFKPQQMRYLLSIKTVFPRPGSRIRYDDQREVHQQIFEGDETIDYAFMGKDPNAADNRWLREAYENQIAVIYFLGIAPGRYQAILPTFITGWDSTSLKARVVFGLSDQDTMAPPHTAPERRYALRKVKQRLHQASFREAVITAYNGRCAMSGLHEPILLDAAHIVADKHERLGQPVVPNGIPLSKIHHAALDAHGA
jgi:putative restriction endonuclease